MLVVTACGSGPQVVTLGGATPSVVERPWGKVKTFPKLEKAQIPTISDLEFTSHMIKHHEQAIELSKLVLKHEDIDDRVSAAARFISLDQGREITVMRLWVKAWESTPQVLPHGAHHGGLSSAMPASRTPGMVSDDKIEQLKRLGSSDAQLAYLKLMIFHHEGAVTMSQEFLRTGKNDFALNAARHLIREQNTEIAYLRLLVPKLCTTAECTDTRPRPQRSTARPLSTG